MTTILYKPCCGMRCCVAGCKTSKAGGCYCVCRLVDHISACEMVLDGRMVRKGGILNTEPGRIPVPLEGEAAEEMRKNLAEARERLKQYEVNKKETHD